MALVLPGGVKIEIELPAYSIMPGLAQHHVEAQPLIVAALSTSHFPVARQSWLELVNNSVSQFKAFEHLRTQRQPNRQQRRRMKKG